MALPQLSAPSLLDHRATVNDTVGPAENIRREGDTIFADRRLPRPSLDSLCERIGDGTVAGFQSDTTCRRWN